MHLINMLYWFQILFVVSQMEKEISILQKEIEHKKPECGRLVGEVNSLIKLMSEQNRG